MRERVAALILKNKKLLMVRDEITNKFYPPGGAIEDGESHQIALARELKEELLVALMSSTFYCTLECLHEVTASTQLEHCYFVEIEGSPRTTKGFELRWISNDDLKRGEIKTFEYYMDSLFKKLEQDSYW